MRLPATLAAMPLRNKLGLGGGVLAVVLAFFLLLKMAGAPSYSLLASGLDPATSGKITAALDDQGIPYQLQANGTSVAVDKSMIGQARIALATKGVSTGSSGSQPGFALFDQQKLGTSDFQQQVTYQRALEGEIANTIQQVNGVTGAQVQLVLPQDDLFQSSSTPATAAVMLDGSGDALDPGAVRGIAQLVASSVKGLKSSNVTITDGSGQLLWPNGDGADGVAGATGKQSAEARYAASLRSQIDDMLLRTLGPGKADVQVSATLNMDKVTKDSLTYAKRGVPLKSSVDTEKLKGAGGAAGGTTGTAGNIPTYAAGGAGAGANSKYNHVVKSTDWGVDKTVAKIQQAPGQVQQLHVALILDKSVAAQAAQIQNAVAGAVGLTPKRGDTITRALVAFPKYAAPKAGPVPVSLIGPIKLGLLGLGALIFAFFTWRFMRKRESEELGDPAWLREITEPVRLSELEAGGPTREMVAVGRPSGGHRDDPIGRLDELMEREPSRVAAQMRTWMNED